MPTITTKEPTTLKIAQRYHHTVKSRLAIVHYDTEHGIKGAAGRFRPEGTDGERCNRSCSARSTAPRTTGREWLAISLPVNEW